MKFYLAITTLLVGTVMTASGRLHDDPAAAKRPSSALRPSAEVAARKGTGRYQYELQEERESDEQATRDEVAESSLKMQMRIAFKPSFERLKNRIGSEITDSEELDWVAAQGDALILAEMMGRLMQWPELSVFDSEARSESFRDHLQAVKAKEVKETAVLLYRATRSRDFPVSQKQFVELAQKCNVCHAKSPGWSPVVLKP